VELSSKLLAFERGPLVAAGDQLGWPKEGRAGKVNNCDLKHWTESRCIPEIECELRVALVADMVLVGLVAARVEAEAEAEPGR